MEQVIQIVQARLSALLPQSVNESTSDISEQLKQVLREALNKLDLVSREEFESQKIVLERTQARLADLEKRVHSMERKLEHPV